MKILSKFVLLSALAGSLGLVREVSATPACVLTLEWQASPDSTVAGYALYYGVDGGPATNRMDAGASTAVTMKNLTAASTYAFYVVAYDADQTESDPSNLLLFTAQAISSMDLGQRSDGSMGVSFHVAPSASCHVEYTDTLNPPNWNVLTNATADADGLVTINDPIVGSGKSRFYRGVVP